MTGPAPAASRSGSAGASTPTPGRARRRRRSAWRCTRTRRWWGLFRLDYRLDYKKGDRARRSAGLTALLALLESVPELRVAAHPRWQEVRATVAHPGPGALDVVEDEVDAVVCAHLAWLWHHRRDALQVYGSAEVGYIVAPPPPTHRARAAVRRPPHALL